MNVTKLQVNQRSQINEDSVEPSLTARDSNPMVYMSDLLSCPGPDLNPGRYH